MKLWEKSTQVNAKIEAFTVGQDREMDLFLAKYDVLGSMAHIKMLNSVGLLQSDELELLLAELKSIYKLTESNEFVIEEGVEDVHSQVEMMLTSKLGDVGKKIHSGRSRNDQVLVDLKLFARAELYTIVQHVDALFELLIEQSNRYKDVLLPGYTHLQIAMPSSFGLWFGAYAESLADDLQFLLAAWKITNRNPLGSAAGYGSSFPLNRQMTTDLLGFDTMNYNVVYAQMGRGKMERSVASAMAGVAATLSKLAYDVCLFSSQNFNFIKFIPQQITLITNNLPSGYFRDLQIIKEVFIPAFAELNACIEMVALMMGEVKVNTEILNESRYDFLFSVEEVNRLTLSGVPFRDAYKQVGLEIEAGNFKPNKAIHHTHEGSIGNLCNDEITAYKNQIICQFNFEKVFKTQQKLVE